MSRTSTMMQPYRRSSYPLPMPAIPWSAGSAGGRHSSLHPAFRSPVTRTSPGHDTTASGVMESRSYLNPYVISTLLSAQGTQSSAQAGPRSAEEAGRQGSPSTGSSTTTSDFASVSGGGNTGSSSSSTTSPSLEPAIRDTRDGERTSSDATRHASSGNGSQDFQNLISMYPRMHKALYKFWDNLCSTRRPAQDMAHLRSIYDHLSWWMRRITGAAKTLHTLGETSNQLKGDVRRLQAKVAGRREEIERLRAENEMLRRERDAAREGWHAAREALSEQGDVQQENARLRARVRELEEGIERCWTRYQGIAREHRS